MRGHKSRGVLLLSQLHMQKVPRSETNQKVSLIKPRREKDQEGQTERMDKMVKDPNTFAETPFKDELTTLKETFTAFKTTALCLNKTMPKQSMDKIGVILLELRGKIRKYEQFLESLANQKDTLRKVT